MPGPAVTTDLARLEAMVRADLGGLSQDLLEGVHLLPHQQDGSQDALVSLDI